MMYIGCPSLLLLLFIFFSYSIFIAVSGVARLLDERDIDYISWEDWKDIDEKERRLGEEKGKVREKFMQFSGFLKKHHH